MPESKKNPPRVQITERDAAVLSWLGEVQVAGTDSMNAAYTHFGNAAMDRKRLSQRLLQMCRANALGSDVLHRGNNRRVYWPIHQRYQITRRDMPHDLIAAHLSMVLIGQSGSGTGMAYNRVLAPEARTAPRRWTRDVSPRKGAHAADGLLWLPNDSTVIVEVELTMKSQSRLATILNSHAKRLADGNDPARHLLYFTTGPVGKYVASAWRELGHAVDHPEAMQVVHIINDATLEVSDITDARIVPIETKASTNGAKRDS